MANRSFGRVASLRTTEKCGEDPQGGKPKSNVPQRLPSRILPIDAAQPCTHSKKREAYQPLNAENPKQTTFKTHTHTHTHNIPKEGVPSLVQRAAVESEHSPKRIRTRIGPTTLVPPNLQMCQLDTQWLGAAEKKYILKMSRSEIDSLQNKQNKSRRFRVQEPFILNKR